MDHRTCQAPADWSRACAGAAALLGLAAEADGTACATVHATSTGTQTSAGVTVVIEVCAEVTAVTDDTVSLGDVTFAFAGAAEADIEVGDELCVTATTSPTGNPVITDDDGTAPAGAGGEGDPALLPDTAATGDHTGSAGIGAVLLVAAGIGWSVQRRRGLRAR